jgi:hypothetical protein
MTSTTNIFAIMNPPRASGNYRVIGNRIAPANEPRGPRVFVTFG